MTRATPHDVYQPSSGKWFDVSTSTARRMVYAISQEDAIEAAKEVLGGKLVLCTPAVLFPSQFIITEEVQARRNDLIAVPDPIPETP